MNFEHFFTRSSEILRARRPATSIAKQLGTSREGKPIFGYRFGSGNTRVSLIGGCHADEPVGPRMLNHLCGYLAALDKADALLQDFDWWIVPHINPDGEKINRRWYTDADRRYNLLRYLRHVVRELPGDDIEFCFPESDGDSDSRPENRAVYDWWKTAGEFHLHVSFHGMGFAAGPWFLVEEAWRERIEQLKNRCVKTVHDMGYELHDVERHGEKGFVRLGKGFCTRPDSGNMKKHFLELGDDETAAKFKPSSMETIRSFGGDPLTLVSEMPLFITPGIGVDLGPPDPVALEWKKRIDQWRARAIAETHDADLADELDQSEIRPMPVNDQMLLQLAFLAAGLEAVGG
jgi:hypothetical protein